MFGSGSYEKGCGTGTPENPTLGRGNNSNRFPVGITTMGDENQQIRIQLAVHKYNNSTQSPGISRRIVTSPIRQPFFAYERNGDLAGKNEKKLENRYEGVGNFPTVHLRKSTVRYRPIRKFNEVKVPYPELPVNRFLNHLPELSTDVKSSTRSVLDVLQDMSRKKIHSKDGDYSGYGSRGLGGGVTVDGEVVPKPLFVQKPRVNAVSTRDNTTQTLFMHNIENSSPKSSSSNSKSDTVDPRAELRRKLAKQNNEIFASLSSSNASFAMKRKIDKISMAKEDRSACEGSSLKRARVPSSNQTTDQIAITQGKVVNGAKTNSGESSTKLTRRSKPGEAGNTTSPNKDRLTTIYLDMEGSPKAEIFQKFVKSNESFWNGAKEDSLHGSETSGKANGTFTVGDSSDPKKTSFSADKQSGTLSLPINSGQNLTTSTYKNNADSVNDSKNQKAVESPGNQFKLEPANKTNFNAGSSEIKSQSEWTLPATTWSNKEWCAATAAGGGVSGTNGNNSGNNVQLIVSPFTSSAKTSKPEQITGFKLSNLSNGSPVLSSNSNISPVDGNVKTSSQATHSSTVTTAVSTLSTSTFSVGTGVTPQFTFGVNSTCVTSKSVTLPIVSSGTTSISLNNEPTSGFGGKPTFTFGNASPTTQSSTTPNKPNASDTTPEKPKIAFSFGTSPATTSNASPTSVSTTANPTVSATNNVTGTGSSSLFSFGQKPLGDASTGQNKNVLDAHKEQNPQIQSAVANNDTSKNAFTNLQAPTSTTVTSQGSNQSTAVSQDNSHSLGTTTATTTTTTMNHSNLFSFGQPPKTTTTTTTTTTPSTGSSIFPITFGQKTPISVENTSKPSDSAAVSSPATFTFGQSPVSSSAGPNLPPVGTLPAQNTQPKVFSFGQTSSTSTSFSSGDGFGSTTQPSPFAQSSISFGKSSSQVTTTTSINTTPTFGQNQTSTTKSTGAFESKPGSLSFGSVPNVSVFGQNTISFGKGPGFGTPATSGQTGFGTTTTQSGVQFGGATFPGTGGFGVTSATAQSFGAPKQTQATIGFGAPSPNSFASTTSASQPTFGAPVTTQASSGFASPFNEQSGFGQLNKTPSTSNSIFDQNRLAQSSTSAFTSTSTNFGATGGQSMFGAKPNTTQESIFGQTQKLPTLTFGGNSVGQGGFGAQNKFTFGSSTSNVTSFTPSPPNTTSAGVFTFGAGTNANSGSSSSFGGSGATTGSSTASTPFSFTSQNTNATTFKFGGSGTNEGTGFDSGSSPAFAFGGQMNNNNPLEGKPRATQQPSTFNFGSAPATLQSTFNFGATPSPSVFSFGSSGSGSSSGGSNFSFGTPQQPGVVFGQGNPSPGTFSAPGTFSIGSGSSTQSRPRASSRLRRRP